MAWRRHNVVWLAGSARGQTLLCQSLDHVEYFDCELRRSAGRWRIPSRFSKASKQGRRWTKSTAGESSSCSSSRPTTFRRPHRGDGSSSLGASSKFGDTLTGGKATFG